MPTGYNERSWAIDVISEINRITSKRHRSIRRAGGERTLRGNGAALFPDVLLFGDPAQAQVIQGWELKFPDTPITDAELVQNAADKAARLNLDSFLIWNVTTAVLYARGGDSRFAPIRTWDALNYVTSRNQVEEARVHWVSLLERIVDTLDTYLGDGTLTVKSAVDAFTDDGVAAMVLANVPSTAAALREATVRDGAFGAEVSVWWRTVRASFPGERDPWIPLAREVLLLWLNRFLFAHSLKATFDEAAIVDEVDESSTAVDATIVFRRLSAQIDFVHVFRRALGEIYLGSRAWFDLVALNALLIDLRFETISQSLLHRLLDKTVTSARRKGAGQYVTPRALAELLVRLVMLDKRGTIVDPFCGTGTIPRAAYDVKRAAGLDAAEALQTVWASDKFAFPLQISTLALSDPATRGEVVRVFQSDAADLSPGRVVLFIDPNNGHAVETRLPVFDAIASNLPFVAARDLDVANPGIAEHAAAVAQAAGLELELSNRSDLYAYLPFLVFELLSEGSSAGVVVSNAWLGTAWGKQFRRSLWRLYHIRVVITSASGRWFEDADVITNILVLERRARAQEPAADEQTAFIALNRSVDELGQGETASRVADEILVGALGPEDASVEILSHERIVGLEYYGLQWGAFFAHLGWHETIAPLLIRASTLFRIARGERRGWDAMFYPGDNHGIESAYLRPVLKSARSISGLWAVPDGMAFCCGKSEPDLQQLGHHGALRWIERFAAQVNGTGVPLPDALRQHGLEWYEMSDRTIADLVTTMNPDKRLFFARMRQRGFVNQRLISLTAKAENVDVELAHALLNSLPALFYIEALGFGRGLSALDLSASRLHDGLFILDPQSVGSAQRRTILAAFEPLLARPVLPLERELVAVDRSMFDIAVLEAFGVAGLAGAIRSALLRLYQIRRSARSQ